MAKSSKTNGKTKTRTPNSTKKVTKEVALLGDEPACKCCRNCEGKASGTTDYCEDNVYVDIAPATVPSFYIYDPNASPLPVIFWCPPNAVPVNMRQELFNAMVDVADQPALAALGMALVNAAGGASALAALIAPHLSVSIACSGCECSCSGIISGG